MNYKGYEYGIMFCNPERDWGENRGKFYIDCPVHDHGYYETYKEAEAKAKKNIDDFISTIPKTKEEWIEALKRCIQPNGYDYELDEQMAWEVLIKASKEDLK